VSGHRVGGAGVFRFIPAPHRLSPAPAALPFSGRSGVFAPLVQLPSAVTYRPFHSV